MWCGWTKIFGSVADERVQCPSGAHEETTFVSRRLGNIHRRVLAEELLQRQNVHRHAILIFKVWLHGVPLNACGVVHYNQFWAAYFIAQSI